jgi:hypothetical protein
MPNAKIFTIFLSANKTFLAKHLLDDNGNGIVEYTMNNCSRSKTSFLK